MSTSGAASASLPSDARSNERPSPNAADFTSRKLPETQTDEPISPLVYWPSRPKNPDDGHPASDWVSSLCIVQKSLHVLDGCGERQRRDRSALAVKGQHVIAACRAITENENLAPSFGAQVDEFVPGAAQEAGEIEVARLERNLARHRL